MTRSVRTRRCPSGFTLLEMLVAIALLGLLLGAVYSFTWNLFSRETRSLDEAAKSQTATMLFDRCEADLMSAVAIADSSPGVTGDSSQITITHRAVLPGSSGAPDVDLQTTTIRFDPRARRVSVTRSDASANPGGSENDGEIPVPVRALQIRYHNGRRWTDRFSSNNGLPAAVELAIWFGVPEDEPDNEPADDFQDFPGDEPNPFDREIAGPGSEMDFPDEPEELGAPDRVRIITIPDAIATRTTRRPETGGSP